MENLKILEGVAPSPTNAQVAEILDRAMARVAKNSTLEHYKLCHSALDLTTLLSSDSEHSVRAFAREAVEFIAQHPEVPPVATLCVYPPFVEVVGLEVDGTPLKITSVAGGFPSAQTFMEVKALECAMAVESGADEIDLVLNVGMMLRGEYNQARAEIELLRAEIGHETTLKVIIESGVLQRAELIYIASLLAMQAGADFVKSSTGKESSVATPEAAVVMCLAIREFYAQNRRKVGFKVAGGIRRVEDAILYLSIVEEVLGEEWLSSEYFRIGASSLAAEIKGLIVG